MGTSVTHRSPRTLAWGAVRAGYEHAEVPEARVLRDVWRAAQADPSADWRRLLSAPAVAACLRIVAESESAGEALSATGRMIGESGEGSLGAEVARRAAVGAFAADDRASAFTARVFGFATDYLVSRDLAGHVGLGSRNGTVREAAEFKDRLKARAMATAQEVAGPGVRPDSWNEVVPRVIRALSET